MIWNTRRRGWTLLPAVAAVLTAGLNASFSANGAERDSARPRGAAELGVRTALLHSDEQVPVPVKLLAGRDAGTEWCQTELRWRAKAGVRGTDGTRPCRTQGQCDTPAVRDSWIPNAGTPIVTLRIKFNVFANSNGSNPTATQTDVDAQMAQVNFDFLPSHIQWVATTEFINDSTYRNFADPEESAMKNTYADSPGTQLNVYVVNIQAGYLGVGTFAWEAAATGTQGGIIIDNDWFGAGQKTLTHEAGHCVGLWHTHLGVSEVPLCSACWERADGLNGDTTGDFASDTAPTPVHFFCSDPGGVDSCSSTPWGQTDPQNYMSYAPDACYTEFSLQQDGRTHCWIDEVLRGWSGETTGACCVGLSCSIDTEDSCEASSGTYLGDGTTCTSAAGNQGLGPCDPGCTSDSDCDDGVICTDDSCDFVTGLCSNVVNDANCPDDGLFCNGTESCHPVLSCVSSGDPCATNETCNEATNTCEAGTTGEGYILSRNPDFSTDDRAFYRDETIYVKVWTDQVDYDNIRKADWHLTSPSGARVYLPLDNNFDTTYTASYALSLLPATDWTWIATVRDFARNRYRPVDTITVLGTLPCTSDADCDDGNVCNGDEVCVLGACLDGPSPECDDGLFCTGVESCDPVLGCVSSGNPCAANETCNDVTNACEPGTTGEGYILSRNPDFSTDDRAFSRGETIYMKVWTDRVDYSNLSRARWSLNDANRRRARGPLTNNFDGTYTSSFDLASLPSPAVDWTFRADVSDNAGSRYRVVDSITVQP